MIGSTVYDDDDDDDDKMFGVKVNRSTSKVKLLINGFSIIIIIIDSYNSDLNLYSHTHTENYSFLVSLVNFAYFNFFFTFH